MESEAILVISIILFIWVAYFFWRNKISPDKKDVVLPDGKYRCPDCNELVGLVRGGRVTHVLNFEEDEDVLGPLPDNVIPFSNKSRNLDCDGDDAS